MVLVSLSLSIELSHLLFIFYDGIVHFLVKSLQVELVSFNLDAVQFDGRQEFLEIGESILKTSMVKKIQTLMRKKVQLILTDKPNLIYTNPNKLNPHAFF